MRKIVIGLMTTLWCGLALAATPKQVDLKTATVAVTFDAERTDISTVVRAITEAGFPAKVRGSGG